MKSVFILLIVFSVISLPLLADFHKMAHGMQEGDWSVADNRYIQKDESAPRAKAWVKAPQQTDMIYEFTMRYEGGGEDGHGGVGLHILADDNTEKGISWGLSDSWLLWLNYDMFPEDKKIPTGLSAQVYKSQNDSDMDIVASISLNKYADLLRHNLDADIPVTIRYYSRTGRVTIADPTGNTMGWYVDLPNARKEKGSYVAARTNGLAVSFVPSDL